MKPSDFNISGKPIPEDVADKIYLHHIKPMERIAKTMDCKLYPSQKSGYRPVWWEVNMGRSGNSQHTFEGKGAVDWTCDDFHDKKAMLVEAIARLSGYTRVAIYQNFIHCDYKHPVERNECQIFKSGADSNWEHIRTIKWT